MKLSRRSGIPILTVTAATGEDRPRGNLQFFGIVAETPLSEISFTSDVVSDNDLIVFDEVAIRAVPEPTGIVLVALAVGCLLAIGRRTVRHASN